MLASEDGFESFVWYGQESASFIQQSIMHCLMCSAHPLLVSFASMGLPTTCWHETIAEGFGHAPIGRKVLSWRAHEEPCWHYESRNAFLVIGTGQKSFAIPWWMQAEWQARIHDVHEAGGLSTGLNPTPLSWQGPSMWGPDAWLCLKTSAGCSLPEFFKSKLKEPSGRLKVASCKFILENVRADMEKMHLLQQDGEQHVPGDWLLTAFPPCQCLMEATQHQKPVAAADV